MSIENITRVCTIPAAKQLKGSSTVFPPNKEVKELFSNIGFCSKSYSFSFIILPSGM